MKILAFNTANNFCSVAISEDQRILAYNENLNNSVQAECLIPLIEQSLIEAKIDYQDLDWLIVTNGPGSFTGIRIGLAAAKGILLSSNIKGTAISNFELACFRAKEQIQNFNKIYIFLNAYRGQVYLQIFDKLNNISKAVILDINEVAGLLDDQSKDIKIIAGDAIEVIYPNIQNIPNLTILPRFAKIKAIHLCKYFEHQLSLGLAQINLIQPLYIRAPDAKIL